MIKELLNCQIFIMKITEIKNKNQWEEFVERCCPNSFLNSWNWGEVNELDGNKVWRIGIKSVKSKVHKVESQDLENLLGVVLIIKVKARRGTFLFCPYGPLIKSPLPPFDKGGIFNIFFDYLKELARKENASFVRISPLLENTEDNLKIFRSAGFRNAPVHLMHPELTWLLDITPSEEKIMKGMRKTTRNLIGRAGRDGVEIFQGTDIKDLENFYRIHEETVRRHKFIPFSFEVLKNQLEVFKKDNQISIFSAKYKNKIISSAIIIFYGDQAFYHHGASSQEYSKIPSSYLLLWEAIREAKKRNKKIFNFWGIVENKPSHPWSGLSKFKKGFGGYSREYLHCQDLAINKKYWLAWAVERARKIKRGY
jgi:lipid II:glycine glycyltransferase (peptidoglycan interpeptide bridge formation enzyme)